MEKLDKTQTPQHFREQFRKNLLQIPTPGLAPGHVQANIVMIPEEYAQDFKEYCKQNPKSCPLIEDFLGFTDSKLAPNSNLTTDLPLYRIWKNGKLESEQQDITSLLQSEEFKNISFHTFLIGCSFTFETAITQQNIEIRHIKEQKNVPMYKTNQLTIQVGPFKGPQVVSMRPFAPENVEKAKEISGWYPGMHGTPLHIGDPKFYGIEDINKPHFGDNVTIFQGEIPVFWGCGVTSQMAVLGAELPIAITHSPGYMFICDAKNEDFEQK